MNFFRLRVINTLLLFLIGTVLGFILKEKFSPPPAAPAKPGYQAPYSAPAEAPPAVQPEPEEPADEPYTVPEAEPGPSAGRAAEEPAREEGPLSSREALVIEATPPSGEDRAAKRPPANSSPYDFFRNPADFEGREVEMDLQMITAKRSARGWRVNLVYTSPEKRTEYLYVDDNEILGEKPDLRIGYAYKVRFLCAKGETTSGNTLKAIAPTGGKAAWATGLSAVE